MRPPLLLYALLALCAVAAACVSTPLRHLDAGESAAEWAEFEARWRARAATGKGL